MRHLRASLANFLIEADGPTTVEYAVLLALIVGVCLIAIGSMGSSMNRAFSQESASISAGS
jgi:pilus assembly protein Flp/PilA